MPEKIGTTLAVRAEGMGHEEYVVGLVILERAGIITARALGKGMFWFQYPLKVILFKLLR